MWPAPGSRGCSSSWAAGRGATIGACSSRRRNWKAKANQELIATLRERLKARPGVKLHWIAGHVGVPGNERADQLANDGVAGRTNVRWVEAG